MVQWLFVGRFYMFLRYIDELRSCLKPKTRREEEEILFMGDIQFLKAQMKRRRRRTTTRRKEEEEKEEKEEKKKKKKVDEKEEIQ